MTSCLMTCGLSINMQSKFVDYRALSSFFSHSYFELFFGVNGSTCNVDF